jgi:xanthine dehydrogenase YagT iron-sulfur-binding subunit
VSKKDIELEPTPERTSRKGFSRRGFLGSTGAAAGVLGTGLTQQEALAAPPAVIPPGETEITLTVNGQARKVSVEPRTTLLDALRERMQITGAKRVCDRGTCGACSMIVNGKVMYGCTILAVDAVGKKIETIEAFSTGKPHPILAAFVEHDALQCGYCTPGMVVASKALLDRNPKPTPEQIMEGLGGNLCRCGTYVGIRKAVAAASGELKGRA